MRSRIYNWLQQTEDAHVDHLRELVRDYVIDNYPVGPGDWFLGDVTRRRWHSIHTDFKESGIRPKRLRKLLVEAGIVGADDAKLTDHRVRFDADSVRPLLRQWRESLNKEDAQSHAGLTHSQLRILVEADFIRPLIDLPGNSRVAFARDELDAFLATVLYSTGEGDPAEMVGVTTAARMAMCSIPDVVHMLVDRKLARVAVSPSRQGFASVLVDPKEVIALLARRQSR